MIVYTTAGTRWWVKLVRFERSRCSRKGAGRAKYCSGSVRLFWIAQRRYYMIRNALALALPLVLITAAQAAPADGQRIFVEHCAMCHRDNGGSRAPQPAVLRQLTRQSIIQALETGSM